MGFASLAVSRACKKIWSNSLHTASRQKVSEESRHATFSLLLCFFSCVPYLLFSSPSRPSNKIGRSLLELIAVVSVVIVITVVAVPCDILRSLRIETHHHLHTVTSRLRGDNHEACVLSHCSSPSLKRCPGRGLWDDMGLFALECVTPP